ncbi:MAG: hypothetical protein NZ554_12335, partial [Bryobacteraceae bacterium]|nr:hypothetical protein [Bryobacteraceae bacterium]
LDGALIRFGPQVLAGPLRRLEQLAREFGPVPSGLLAAVHALIVLVRPHEPLLDETGRARLWELFQAPVYQQVVGFDGRLLAWECEAHEGLHLVAEHAIAESCGGAAGGPLLLTSLTDRNFPMLRLKTPWPAALIHSLCGCGQPGERIFVRVERGDAKSEDAAGLVAAGAAARPVLF